MELLSTLGMILTLAVAAFLGFLSAFTGRIQIATMWAGRAIASTGFDTAMSMPTGYQSALTPPWQTRNNVIGMIGFVVVLIVGSLQAWYFGILALVVAGIVYGITGVLFPKEAAWYLKPIVNSLQNREADYEKVGDSMRAEAARYMGDRVTLLLMRASSTNERLPSMVEATATPTGQLDDWA